MLNVPKKNEKIKGEEGHCHSQDSFKCEGHSRLPSYNNILAMFSWGEGHHFLFEERIARLATRD